MAQKPPKINDNLGHASTMAGLGPSEPKNLAKMNRIWVRNGPKFASNELHVQLGLGELFLRSEYYTDAPLMLVALFCSLHAELCCLLAAAE